MGRDNTCSTARYAYERRYLVNTFGGDEHVRITLYYTTEYMDSWRIAIMTYRLVIHAS